METEITNQQRESAASAHVGGDNTTGPWPGWYTLSIYDAHAALCAERPDEDPADLWSVLCEADDAEIARLGGQLAAIADAEAAT